MARNCHFQVIKIPVDKFFEHPSKPMIFAGFFYQFEDFKMTVINTNIAASVTANAMKANQRTMETTMERLATGLRVNSAI